MDRNRSISPEPRKRRRVEDYDDRRPSRRPMRGGPPRDYDDRGYDRPPYPDFERPRGRGPPPPRSPSWNRQAPRSRPVAKKEQDFIKVTLQPGDKDGEVVEGACVGDLLKWHLSAMMESGDFKHLDRPLVGALVNGNAKSLQWKINYSVDTIGPIFADTPMGSQIIRRSLVFCVAMAIKMANPECHVQVEHQLHDRVLLLLSTPEGDVEVDETVVKHVHEELRSLADSESPIDPGIISYNRAMKLFHGNDGKNYSVTYLRSRHQAEVPVYVCPKFNNMPASTANLDKMHCCLDTGTLFPNTSFARIKEAEHSLCSYRNFLVLKCPPRVVSEEGGAWSSTPMPLDSKHALCTALKNIDTFKHIHQLKSCAAVNALARAKKTTIKGRVALAEGVLNRQLSRMVDDALTEDDGIKGNIILIGGPAASGIQTVAQKVSTQLRLHGRRVIEISTVEYDTMAEERLKPDTDSKMRAALDVRRLVDDLSKLLKGEAIVTPKGRKLLYGDEHTILIFDGLSPLSKDKCHPFLPSCALTLGTVLKGEKIPHLKVHVEPISQLYLVDLNRVSARNVRAIRFVVQCAQELEMRAPEALARWQELSKWDSTKVFQYQEQCDVLVNTFLPHEIGVLKTYAEPLLRCIPCDATVFLEARELLSFLSHFDPIPASAILDDSVLHEFLVSEL
eukprot:TRINITY_DN4092_c0_g1_i1.p1 TRINITY_DN4092_c0_g1~~TRINITY_DN4092_c0_g1_i1.p1  ORF type:complete len:676 (+),score=214.03 TRINITY_DN4092_c0_g1_i1:51-2078(+)